MWREVVSDRIIDGALGLLMAGGGWLLYEIRRRGKAIAALELRVAALERHAGITQGGTP